MNRKFKFILTLLIVVMAINLSACENSDAETEQNLEGSWQYTYSETEDGVHMTVTATESYSLEDHRFNSYIIFHIGYPINADIATVTYEGKWYATKKEIVNDIEKGSVNFSFNKRLLDKSDREEFKDEILRELKKNDYQEGVRIKSPITDSFIAEDNEGEEYHYTRIC